MFGRNGVSRLDKDDVERLSLGYLMAVEELQALVKTIKERLPNANTEEEADLRSWHKVLVDYHNRIVTVGKHLPPPDAVLTALAKEADAMEEDIARIHDALWGYDEARVGGLLLAAGVLHD